MIRRRQLQLGTLALVAQAAPAAAPAPITHPDRLARGTEVWVYFRRWLRGRVQRVIPVDRSHANNGAHRGNRAVVLLEAHGERAAPVTLRRKCDELIPVGSDDPPDHREPHANRKEAEGFAREWWVRSAIDRHGL